VPSWLDRGAELAGYPWATGAEMACCTLLQNLPRYNKVPSWRPPGGILSALFSNLQIDEFRQTPPSHTLPFVPISIYVKQ
jgi:hypothetical protein